MRLYPTVLRRRAATLARDLLVLAFLLVLAWLGLWVHDAIDALAVLGRGVQDAGASVQGGFDAAAETVAGAPVVGGELGDALRDAGRATGGEAAELGRDGEESVHDAADLLGWVTFLVPAVLLLSRVLPERVAQVRALTAADRVLRGGDDPVRRALLAERAAFGLPYATLLRHTRDPIGDLADGRFDALVAAVREDAGLR
jgi:hypothetical protein